MKKRKISLRHLLVCLLGCMSYFLMSGAIQARPLTLQLLTSPLNVKTIEVGMDTDPITIIARVDSEDVQFTWTLAGPGQLEEDSPPRKVFYTPPAQLAAESVETTITVSATDVRGDTAYDSITFILYSEQPTATSTISPEILQLLKTADAYFQRTFYTEPEGQNALSLYQQALEIDPANQHALEKIHTMAENYKMWAERDVQQQNYDRARKYYERYLLIAEYLSSTFNEQQLTQDIHTVQQQLQELELPATPSLAPTFTPSPPPSLPTATPTPIPPTPEPTLPPTPTVKQPTPTPTTSPIVQFLEHGDAYFEQKQYTTPKEENAFGIYQRVLQIDPDNQHAKTRIREIASIYKQWADSDYQRQNYTKALTFYERYLSVAEYLLFALGDEKLRPEIVKVKNIISTSPPTPTPHPESISDQREILECPSETRDFETIQHSLFAHLEKYKVLKQQELSGKEQNSECIPVIQLIICEFIAIERLLQENYEKTSDNAVLQRIQKTETTRKSYEAELFQRLNNLNR